MIMKTVSVTKHAIILNMGIYTVITVHKRSLEDYFLLGIERIRKCYGYMQSQY